MAQWNPISRKDRVCVFEFPRVGSTKFIVSYLCFCFVFLKNKPDALFCFCARLPVLLNLLFAQLLPCVPASGKNRSSACLLRRASDRRSWISPDTRCTHWLELNRSGDAFGNLGVNVRCTTFDTGSVVSNHALHFWTATTSSSFTNYIIELTTVRIA